MRIYPAIDIRGGNAVRLFQGDYSKEKIYSINPVDVALKFKKAGAERLHVVLVRRAADVLVIELDEDLLVRRILEPRVQRRRHLALVHLRRGAGL